MKIYFLIFVTLFIQVSTAEIKEKSAVIPEFIRNYLSEYCYKCHDEDVQKGDRRLDLLSLNLEDHLNRQLWQDVLDQLNLGEMPPRKKNSKFPKDEENKKVISWITNNLKEYHLGNIKSSSVMRQLNRQEYLNTMSHLLAVNTESFDPTSEFPIDNRIDGVDTIGEAQVLSGYQLNLYLDAAEKFLDKAIHFKNAPKAQKFIWTVNDFYGVKQLTRPPVRWSLKVGNEYVEHGHGRSIAMYPCYSRKFGDKGVPEDGYYKIRIKAEAHNRLTHPYQAKDFPMDLSKKMKMGLVIANDSRALTKNAAENRRLVNVFELTDNKALWYESEVWIDKGGTPFVHWINGSGKTKKFIREIAKKYHPEVMGNLNRSKGTYTGSDAGVLKGKVLSEVYDGPGMRFYRIEIEGPLYKTWPPESHRRLFGNTEKPEDVDIKKSVKLLLDRAFRRNVTEAEVEKYSSFIASRIKAGENRESALKTGFKAILSSPNFLFIPEISGSNLNQFELASRLSYFLWSSSPDDELLNIAKEGRLSDLDVLKSQAQRMLEDHKAQNFTKRFADSWLRLSDLGKNPPDIGKFRDFYDNRLEEAMRTETYMFVNHILKNKRDIMEFLNARYTFLNDVLADHYGIKGVVGEKFRKVTIPSNLPRQGLLGHGSILTLTSNGVETSPVIRGIWLLENILGTPPSPPPPDVEPLEPDVRGTKTIREQLEKHRSIESCADCHRKIDPLGFALEVYDPIGKYRKSYPNFKGVIDSSGSLPGGESFRDIQELNKVLITREFQFTKTLSDRLLMYSTGRHANILDKEEMSKISRKVLSEKRSFYSLLLEIICSESFKRK